MNNSPSDFPPRLIDSHTHLDSDVFLDDQDGVVSRAALAGVDRLITIGAGGGNGLRSTERALGLANKYPGVYASVGVHPHDAQKVLDLPFNGEIMNWGAISAVLTEWAKNPRVVAIGETGLDFFRDWAPVEAQREAFRAQISVARSVKKPLIIHSREAGRECIETIKEFGAGEVTGVFHCYSEGVEFAAELREIGFLVSFPGTLTFKSTAALREIARNIPLEQIMVETDAPYMTPEPHRGKRCESAYVVEVAKVLSQIKNISYQECCHQLTQNTERLFKIE